MLNLIADPWIPVRCSTGLSVVRPDQIADPHVLGFAWPRPDLNLACYELMIGMTYLACPPDPDEDASQTPPDHSTLKDGLTHLGPAFELLGDGPRFMQDFEPLQDDPNPPDMLFIDSAGASSAKKNSDLMVKRNRYGTLPLPLAAMALYTLQAFAPAGGAGNRTSMRGGGPMVTLVHPKEAGLWPLIWSNVPPGAALPAAQLARLPLMRPTVTSEKEQVVVPQGDSMDSCEPGMFFGQPRRLRLVAEGDRVTGVIQRPYGTKYEGWRHYLTPYYLDSKAHVLPMHPKPGPFGYRNWRGIILQSDKHHQPENLQRQMKVPDASPVDLIVAGWAMDNMKPLDFVWSEQPVFPLSDKMNGIASGMVEAAEQAGYALATCIQDSMGESSISKGAADRSKQAFFNKTHQPFVDRVAAISNDNNPDPKNWLDVLRRTALDIFDEAVLPGLAGMQETRRQKAVKARRSLSSAFSGHNKLGRKIFEPLALKLPPKKRQKKENA